MWDYSEISFELRCKLNAVRLAYPSKMPLGGTTDDKYYLFFK